MIQKNQISVSGILTEVLTSKAVIWLIIFINKKAFPKYREGFLKILLSDYLFHHKRVDSLSAPPSFATPVARPNGFV